MKEMKRGEHKMKTTGLYTFYIKRIQTKMISLKVGDIKLRYTVISNRLL